MKPAVQVGQDSEGNCERSGSRSIIYVSAISLNDYKDRDIWIDIRLRYNVQGGKTHYIDEAALLGK